MREKIKIIFGLGILLLMLIFGFNFGLIEGSAMPPNHIYEIPVIELPKVPIESVYTDEYEFVKHFGGILVFVYILALIITSLICVLKPEGKIRFIILGILLMITFGYVVSSDLPNEMSTIVKSTTESGIMELITDNKVTRTLKIINLEYTELISCVYFALGLLMIILFIFNLIKFEGQSKLPEKEKTIERKLLITSVLGIGLIFASLYSGIIY